MQRDHKPLPFRRLLLAGLLLAGLLLVAGCSSGAASSSVSQPVTTVPATAPATTTSSVVVAVSAGETSTLPGSPSTTAPVSLPAERFDGARAMAHIEMLASQIGVRQAGTAAEETAKDYASTYLQSLGYSVHTIDVPLPNGRVSHDVWAVREGSSPP